MPATRCHPGFCQGCTVTSRVRVLALHARTHACWFLGRAMCGASWALPSGEGGVTAGSCQGTCGVMLRASRWVQAEAQCKQRPSAAAVQHSNAAVKRHARTVLLGCRKLHVMCACLGIQRGFYAVQEDVHGRPAQSLRASVCVRVCVLCRSLGRLPCVCV